MFQAKIDCWWLNFIIFPRQEADVAVLWDMFQVKLAKGHLCLSFQVEGVLLYSFQVKLTMGHLCNIFQVGEVKAEQLKRADGSGD